MRLHLASRRKEKAAAGSVSAVRKRACGLPDPAPVPGPAGAPGGRAGGGRRVDQPHHRAAAAGGPGGRRGRGRARRRAAGRAAPAARPPCRAAARPALRGRAAGARPGHCAVTTSKTRSCCCHAKRRSSGGMHCAWSPCSRRRVAGPATQGPRAQQACFAGVHVAKRRALRRPATLWRSWLRRWGRASTRLRSHTCPRYSRSWS